jgi:hypothetical protein
MPRHLTAVSASAGDHALVVERLRTRIASSGTQPFDGMVWLAHLDHAGEPCLFTRLHDPVAHLDELYVRDLLSTLEGVAMPGVAVAIWRDDGRALAVDRRFARNVSDRLAEGSCALAAVLLVDREGHRAVLPGRGGRSGGAAGRGQTTTAADVASR